MTAAFIPNNLYNVLLQKVISSNYFNFEISFFVFNVSVWYKKRFISEHIKTKTVFKIFALIAKTHINNTLTSISPTDDDYYSILVFLHGLASGSQVGQR